MIDDKGIKIQNIYYMLTYAFSILKQDGYDKLGSEDFENTAQLMGAILSKGIARQVKCGLGKEYIAEEQSLSTIKGKIDISQSIKAQTFLKKQLICTYDDFSINTKFNQIIKTTVLLILKTNIKKETKKELMNLMLFFKEVDVLNPYIIDWNIRYNRNNKSYEMLINICYLVIKGLLQKDENGNMKMQKFLDEKRMCRLYEKFILEYYKKEFPSLKVTSSQIPWDVDGEIESLVFLPIMQSDIMISNGEKTIIIDAKYYSKTMNVHYDKHKLHSHNLYQIFTYVKNADVNKYGEISGVLLYAMTSEEVVPDTKYNMSGNMIYSKCLDLSKYFDVIREQLNNMIDLIA